MNPWIDVGMWVLVIACLGFLVVECRRLLRWLDERQARDHELARDWQESRTDYNNHKNRHP